MNDLMGGDGEVIERESAGSLYDDQRMKNVLTCVSVGASLWCMATLNLDIDTDGTWALYDPTNGSNDLYPHERNDLSRSELDSVISEAIGAGHDVTMRARKVRELRRAGLALAGIREI